MNYEMDSTVKTNIKYDYKNSESTIFNRVLSNLSKLFGGLEYNEMRVNLNDMSYVSPPPPDINKPKHDQFEYKIEFPSGIDEWNEKGKDGWEMVAVTKCEDIIWKRKL